MISKIEIEFGIPVHVTAAQERRIAEVIEEITGQPWNVPLEGVHWLAGMGSKPKFSQADALFLGREPDPDAPENGEPDFDDEVLVFETHARAFVTHREREEAFREREGLGLCSVCQEPQWKSPAGVTCVNGHGGAPAKES